MEELGTVLCVLIFVGSIWAWLAMVRAGVRWYEHKVQAPADRAREAAEQAAADYDAEMDALRGKMKDAAKAEDIVRRATGRAPEPESSPPQPPTAGRPKLRLIPGGPDAEPPTDLPGDQAEPSSPPPKPQPPDLPAGPPFPAGQYQLELPDPSGPRLTVWQRGYVRALLQRHKAQLGRDLRELTTAEAEALVAALGGDTRQLYRWGRAWGQRHR